MLKLEKIAKTHELNILLRSRPTFFTVTFLCALSYALLIHFGALLVFKIAPFQVNYQQSLFPPVRVATELPILRGIYFTSNSFEENGPIPEFLMAPLPNAPTLPKAYKMIPIIPKESTSQLLSFSTLFIPQEDISVIKKEAEEYEVLNFHFSGALAELSPVNSLSSKLDINTIGSSRVLFSVKVDKLRGVIFWWEVKGVPESKKVLKLAIEKLKSLQFSPQKFPDIISGEIEFVLIPKCGDSCND